MHMKKEVINIVLEYKKALPWPQFENAHIFSSFDISLLAGFSSSEVKQ